MSNELIYEKIDLYLDNELNEAEHGLLFTELGKDAKGREYFKQAHLLRLAVKHSQEEFPQELDRKVLSMLSKERGPVSFDFTRFAAYAASAAAVILVALTILMYGEFRETRYRLTELDTKVKEQNITIEMLYNSFPTVTVKPTINN